MAKISVIIPAYNAETTLRTAVESILSQQVPELEIIIVNDGSTDGTNRLCHALASEYPCIHVITQKNAGICAARNRGMEAASGEYITFCDDDDLFWQGALRLLLQTLPHAVPVLRSSGARPEPYRRTCGSTPQHTCHRTAPERTYRPSHRYEDISRQHFLPLQSAPQAA